MCQAIVKPAGISIQKNLLQLAWNDNADGAGFAYRRKNKIIIRKGFFTFRKFWSSYRKSGAEMLDCLIHFRFATHGNKNKANCHPHRFENAAMVHNGIFSQALPAPNDSRSDTRIFLDDLYAPAYKTNSETPHEFIQRNKIYTQSQIASNKIAFLSPDGFTILNEAHGAWVGGVWWSSGLPTPRYKWADVASDKWAKILSSRYDDDQEDLPYSYRSIKSDGARCQLCGQWRDQSVMLAGSLACGYCYEEF